MKKILIVFLLLPFYSIAQENLLGKSRSEIRNAFKLSKVSVANKNNLYGKPYSDSFKIASEEVITCGYNKDKLCVEVIKLLKLSVMDSIRTELNRNYIQKDGETFSTDVWADKAKTFKIHLEIYKITDKVCLDYLPYNKPYVIY